MVDPQAMNANCAIGGLTMDITVNSFDQKKDQKPAHCALSSFEQNPPDEA